jgi:hypothetical protein
MNPPANRPASCSIVMIWTPLAFRLAASTRGAPRGPQVWCAPQLCGAPSLRSPQPRIRQIRTSCTPSRQSLLHARVLMQLTQVKDDNFRLRRMSTGSRSVTIGSRPVAGRPRPLFFGVTIIAKGSKIGYHLNSVTQAIRVPERQSWATAISSRARCRPHSSRS